MTSGVPNNHALCPLLNYNKFLCLLGYDRARFSMYITALQTYCSRLNSLCKHLGYFNHSFTPTVSVACISAFDYYLKNTLFTQITSVASVDGIVNFEECPGSILQIIIPYMFKF